MRTERRLYQRFQHSLPASLHLGRGQDDAVDVECRLKDISAAALCLQTSSRLERPIPRGARARVVIQRSGDHAPLEIPATLLYSLAIPTGERHYVFLFDRLREEVITSSEQDERIDVLLQTTG